MRSLLTLSFPLVLALSGCVSRKYNATGTAERSAEVVAHPQCDTGETYTGLIVEKAPSLDVNLVKIPGLELPQFVEPSNGFQVRIDVCLGATVKYKQLALIRLPRYNKVTYGEITPTGETHSEEGVTLPANKFEVRGLEAALFDQDWSKLEIDVRPNWYNGFTLKGWGTGDQGFVTFFNWRWDVRSHVLQPENGEVLVGRLVSGNLVDPNHKCRRGTYRESQVTLGTAKLEFETCGEYRGSAVEYEVLRLKITDTADFLRDEDRVVEITRPEDLLRVPEDEVENDDFYGAPYAENRLYFDVNHHNACDTFYLNLRHAQFSGTSSLTGGTGGGWDGCAPGVVTAPRARDVEGMIWTVKYKETGRWEEEREHPKVHHFFANENERR